MTAPARHPDPEQLAAFAAGEPEVLDPLIIQAHLDVCSVCAADVQALHALDSELAALAEPALPAGLAERLAAAVRAENAAHPPTAPPVAAAFGQVDDPERGQRPAGAGQGGDDRHGSSQAAPVTPLRPRSARQHNVRRLMWVAAAALVLLAVVFVGQLEGLDTTANDSRAGPEPPPPTQASNGAPASGEPTTPQGDRTTSGQDGTGDGRQQPESRTEPQEGGDAPDVEQAPGAPAQPRAGPPASTQPPSTRQAQPRREVAPEVAPRSAPADDGDGEDGGEAPPPDASPRREDPSENVAPPSAPNDPQSVTEADECEAAVQNDGRTPVDVRESSGEGQPTVVIAEDAQGRRFEYTFPKGNCTAEPQVSPQPTSAP